MIWTPTRLAVSTLYAKVATVCADYSFIFTVPTDRSEVDLFIRHLARMPTHAMQTIPYLKKTKTYMYTIRGKCKRDDGAAGRMKSLNKYRDCNKKMWMSGKLKIQKLQK